MLGAARVALFAPAVLGALAIFAVPKVLVEFMFGVSVPWGVGGGAIFSLSVNCSRQAREIKARTWAHCY